MDRLLPRVVWAVLLAGAGLSGCSKDRSPAGEARPKARPASSQASSTLRDEPRADTSGDSADAGAPVGPVPIGYVAVTVAGVTPTPAGAAVMLLHSASRRVVPIFVAGTEAMSIELRLEHRRYARPLTHDLFDSVLDKVGATVTSVRVDKLYEGTYYATVVMDFEGKEHEFDARSSDAVAVALGQGAPIQMAEAIVAQAGVSLDSLGQRGALDGGLTADASAEEGAGSITL